MSKVATIVTARLIGAAVILAALTFQAWADLTLGTFTWGQLPGYFTPLAAIAGVVALAAAAITGGAEPMWVALMRVNAATYLVIAGAVYWAVLAQFAQPVFPWANAVLHGGAGIVLLADWLLVRPRRALPSWSLWTVLAMPAGWIAYLVARALHDGWVPYPFLDPSRGPVAIALTLTVIASVGMGVAGILHWVAALRLARATTSRTATSG